MRYNNVSVAVEYKLLREHNNVRLGFYDHREEHHRKSSNKTIHQHVKTMKATTKFSSYATAHGCRHSFFMTNRMKHDLDFFKKRVMKVVKSINKAEIKAVKRIKDILKSAFRAGTEVTKEEEGEGQLSNSNSS